MNDEMREDNELRLRLSTPTRPSRTTQFYTGSPKVSDQEPLRQRKRSRRQPPLTLPGSGAQIRSRLPRMLNSPQHLDLPKGAGVTSPCWSMMLMNVERTPSSTTRARQMRYRSRLGASTSPRCSIKQHELRRRHLENAAPRPTPSPIQQPGARQAGHGDPSLELPHKTLTGDNRVH